MRDWHMQYQAEHAWLVSKTRRTILFLGAYAISATIFFFAGVPDAAVYSIVPAVAFVLLTVILHVAKDWWLLRIFND